MNKASYKKPWFVYIVKCCDKTLYTGIAVDLKQRIGEHNSTATCKYTRTRKPVKLVYKEIQANRSLASRREAEIKRFSRREKHKLINAENVTVESS